jgi:DNA-binding beta-propeller fold protein YncE
MRLKFAPSPRVPFMRRALFLLPLLWSLHAQAQTSKSLLVINSGEATMSVLDLASHTEERRIPALREPHHWALTPDRQDLLIGDTAANEFIVLDPFSFAVKRHIVMPDPYQFMFSPNGKLLVVAGLARKQVDVYEAGTYKLLHRFTMKTMPSHIDFTPDSSTAFVSLQGTDKAAAIDLVNMRVKWEAPTGPAPAGVMWLNGHLLVAIMNTDHVDVLDPETGATTGHIQAGKGAHQLFLSPDRKTLFINSRVDSTIEAVDAATFKPIRTYHVPGGPDDLVFAPDGKIWTTLRFVAKVGILDLKTGNYETIPVGRSPHGIYIHGATNSGGGN